MKDKPPKERMEYFWEYYKLPALSVVLVIVIIISSIVAIANRKEDVFYGTLMNCSVIVEDSTYLDDFYPLAGIDVNKQAIVFSTDVAFTENSAGSSLDPSQILYATIAAKRVDIIVGPDHVYEKCSYNGSRMLADLRDIVDAETLEQWKDRIYYIDGDVLEEVRNSIATMPELPDPFDPESMSDPIPVAIDISDCTAFQKAYYPTENTLYLGIAINAPHPEMTLQFIDYLLTK